MERKYILGIDQGGTKTAAAVMKQDGTIVGQAVAEGAYFPSIGIERAFVPIEQAVTEALRETNIESEDIALVTAGITGVDWPGDDVQMENALREKFSVKDVFVCNDALVALYSGTLRRHGAVICAGTGMNGALVNREGRQFVYGDYMEESAQGGSALAIRAARKVFDAELGTGKPTALRELFLKRTELESVDKLLHRYMTEEGFRYKLRFLVPEIMTVALQGDEAAGDLLDEFAGQIVDYVIAGFRKMGMKAEEEEIILAGNVFKGKKNPLTDRTICGLEKRLPGAKVLRACYEPVVGACIMGLVRLDLTPEKQEKQIRESASALGLCLD